MSRSDRHGDALGPGAVFCVSQEEVERMRRAAQEFHSEPAPSAAAILKAGLKHMEDRAQAYDNPLGERSMSRTVEAFNAITGSRLTEEQGWLFMVLLKTVRSQQGAYKADNYEDGAAYFGLMGEAASSRAQLEGGQ